MPSPIQTLIRETLLKGDTLRKFDPSFVYQIKWSAKSILPKAGKVRKLLLKTNIFFSITMFLFQKICTSSKL